MALRKPRPLLRHAALMAIALASLPAALAPGAASAQVRIGFSVHIGPPPLPAFYQPPIPGPDYIWTPGYWAWDDWWGDYYWVPGTWVLPPAPGHLWTPGYWGWNDGVYLWHPGYWGRHVGWYGGINYGYGYNGFGFSGGSWHGDHFFYNRAYTNISNNTNITNVYNRRVVNNYTTINNNRTSFAGGPGGVKAQPTPEQRMAMNERHIAATPQQAAHIRAAQATRASFASVNHGRPMTLAVARPMAAPAVPVHPVGMARPAPGGGRPAPAGFVHPETAAKPGHTGAMMAGGVAAGLGARAAAHAYAAHQQTRPNEALAGRQDNVARGNGMAGAADAAGRRAAAQQERAQHGQYRAEQQRYRGEPQSPPEDRAMPRVYRAEQQAPRSEHEAQSRLGAEEYRAPSPRVAQQYRAQPQAYRAPPEAYRAPRYHPAMSAYRPPAYHAPAAPHPAPAHRPQPHGGGNDGGHRHG